MNNFGTNIADMYAGLMMIFLFISISMLVETNKNQSEIDETKSKMTKIIYTKENLRQEIYNTLNNEFSKDLVKWNATIDNDLTIRFQNPDLLFESGSSELGDNYKAILSDFFPRYMAIVKTYGTSVASVSIDGHTSSTGWRDCTGDCSYFRNMYLSQQRSINTLSHCWGLVENMDKLFMKNKFVATGLSYSNPIYKKGDCPENIGQGLDCQVIDDEKSKRVEFTIKLENTDFTDSLELIAKK